MKFQTVRDPSFFWSVFSHIWTKYEHLKSKSLYSVQMRENVDQKKLRIWALFTQRLENKNFSYITWKKFSESPNGCCFIKFFHPKMLPLNSENPTNYLIRGLYQEWDQKSSIWRKWRLFVLQFNFFVAFLLRYKMFLGPNMRKNFSSNP